MEISEKVAYLKGLAEGLNLDTDSKEGKLIAAIIDVLDDMAEKFADIEDELCDVEDGLDAVSDDLSDVEETLYFAYIYGRCSLLQSSHFGQKVTFGLAYFLRSRFLAPVPVV